MTDTVAVWRIDDLARMSGITVDTIRFYQREGLLPPAQRHGRTIAYGPEHLERLECIRELQARHFSLKGIAALVAEGRLHLLTDMFVSTERSYSRAELVTESGLPEHTVAALEQSGVLLPPRTHGGLAYDGEDLAALRALAEAMERGMPEAVALQLTTLYHEFMERLRSQLYGIFAVGGGGVEQLSDKEIDAFRTLAANDIDAFMIVAGKVLQYIHRRCLQRMVVDAMGEVGAAH